MKGAICVYVCVCIWVDLKGPVAGVSNLQTESGGLSAADLYGQRIICSLLLLDGLKLQQTPSHFPGGNEK